MASLQDYFNQYSENTDADKIDAAAEYSGLPPAKIKKSPGLLMNLLDALDRPGNATRALLVGKLGGLKGLIPFAQTIEDLTGWDIALNPDERVTGEEVLEKYTGIKDKKGKFDPADVLGFLIEVVADPLWLIGPVGGLTKAGKAAKVVKATHKSVKAIGSADDLVRAMSKAGWADDVIQKTVKNTITKDTLKSIHKHFRLGKALPENVNKKLIKSFSTLYEGGKLPKGIFKAKSWAEQAAAGERALLHLGLPGMRRPVVKGVGTLDKLDTIATKIRMGWVGEKFLHTTKRVSTKNQKAFYDATKGMTDQGKYFTQNAFGQIDIIGKHLDEKTLKDLMPHMEYVGGVRKATEKLDMLDMIRGLDDLQGDDLADALRFVGVEAGDIKNLSKSEILNKYTKIFESNKKEMQRNLVDLLDGYDSIKSDVLSQASDEYAGMMDNILNAEAARGLPSPSLKGKFGYAPRQYTKKFLNWRKKKGTINLEHKGRTFSVQHGSQITRDPNLRKMTRLEIEDQFALKGFRGDVFEHPQAALAERMAKGYKAMGAANAIYESIDQFGKPVGGDGMTSISKMLKELRLEPKGDILKRIGNKEFIDDDIASALTNQFKFAQKDTVETAINKITKAYKTALTIPFPAFHTRNFMTATTMNFMDGVVNPRFYKKATQLQIAETRTRHLARKEGISFVEASKKVKWPKVNTAGGTLDGAVFYNRLEQNRLVGEVAGHFSVADELNLGGKFRKKTAGRQHGVKERMFAASMAMENNPRIANVLAHAEGMPLDEAIRNSKRVHFDYCFDDQTEILTDDGWKKWDEINYGHKALTCNLDEDCLEWSKINDINIQDYDGKLNHWHSSRFDACMTDNHKWISYGSPDNNKWTGCKTKFSLKKAKDINSTEIKVGCDNYKAPEWRIHSDAYVELVGWVLTEGNYAYSPNECSIQIYQSVVNPYQLKELEHCWTKIQGEEPGSFSHYVFEREKNIHSFYVGMELARKIITRFPDKQLDVPFLTELTYNQLELLYETLIKTDGHRRPAKGNRNHQDFFAQKGDKFSAAFQALCFMLGKRSNCRKYHDVRQNTFCNNITVYRSKKVTPKTTKREKVDYTGKIWCISTDNKTLVARRNGTVYLSGNSDLSEAEKGLRDNVVLFWTFARKNIAAQTKYLYQKPAKMAIFSKLAGGTPDVERRYNLPKYMQERIDIPTPFEDEEGRTMNVRGLGLPMEEAFGSVSAPGAGVFDRMSRFMSRMAAKTVPTFKTPIEIATKKNLYFDRDITDVGEFVEQALPTSRITNTVKRFGRDDQPDTKALDLVTGIKYTPAYDDFYKSLSEREIIESRLKKSPRFKSFTRYYPADKEAATPGDKALLKRLYKNQ